MLHANFVALCFIEPKLLTEVRVGSFEFRACLLCDLDLDMMTFIYELHPYSLELYLMYSYELPTSRLSKLIV